jgi:hypothetical protein
MRQSSTRYQITLSQRFPSCKVWQICDECLISINQECTSLVTRNRQSNIWCVLWLLQRRLYSLEYHSHSVFSGWNLNRTRQRSTLFRNRLSDPSLPSAGCEHSLAQSGELGSEGFFISRKHLHMSVLFWVSRPCPQDRGTASRKLIDDPQGGNCVREKWKKGWSYEGRAESWYET